MSGQHTLIRVSAHIPSCSQYLKYLAFFSHSYVGDLVSGVPSRLGKNIGYALRLLYQHDVCLELFALGPCAHIRLLHRPAETVRGVLDNELNISGQLSLGLCLIPQRVKRLSE
ncbi:hypothetical protein KCV03_g110, partial [Aureobasidium melanogenum]